MKPPLIACTLTMVLILTAHSCLSGDWPSAPKVANATNEFTIAGMHCNGCAQGLGSELQRARGVASATVSFTNRLAVVAYNTNRTSTARLIEVIEESGFKAKKVER